MFRARDHYETHIPDEPLDDDTPLFDGTSGRPPLSPNPVPSGYPTPYTTGLRGVGIDVADLTPHAGGTFSTPGQVVEGFDFTGPVNINAAGITFRRNRLSAEDFFNLYVQPAGVGAVIEDCRLRSAVGSAAIVLAETDDVTIRRCDISGGADQIKQGGNNLVIEDCYVAAGFYSIPLDLHNDVFQSGGGTGLTIQRCSFIAPWREQTSCCLIKADFSDIDDVNLIENYFSGGNFCVYLVDVGTNVVTNVTLTDNRFELNSWNPVGGNYLDPSNAAGLTETGTMILAS